MRGAVYVGGSCARAANAVVTAARQPGWQAVGIHDGTIIKILLLQMMMLATMG